LRGNAAAGFPIQDPPAAFPYPAATFSGVEGQIRSPIINDPIAGPINGQPRLTAAEVASIINFAADRVRTTRAGIRLPIGARAEVFISVVNFPNTPGVSPTVLGTFRTGDATIFSWDVSVQKARTAVGFSSNTRAFSTRTVGFLAQVDYPPGIDPEPPGPFFGMQEALSTPPPNPNFPNGITIFPGGFPLYRNGQLIGAVGISGDGVDQDDIIGASGTIGFQPPEAIEADRFTFGGTRLPYAKFPRDPNGVSTVTPVTLPAMAALTAATAELGNISVRLQVDEGEKLMIGGFIISGNDPKRVVIRALGPSLAPHGVTDPLAQPKVQLHDASGAVLAANERWREGDEAALVSSGLAPADEGEAAVVRTLEPGAYTASVTGLQNGTGVGLLEIYDADNASPSRLANISSRGFVGRDAQVMIGGFIVSGNSGSAGVVVRALGPSLAAHGIAQPLADPVLELRDSHGVLLGANDSWAEAQAGEIAQSGFAPAHPAEAALLVAPAPGAYTAVLQGSGGGTGVALLEVYRLP
jgi:uncharacterized protein GlcG (DUF336 family)